MQKVTEDTFGRSSEIQVASRSGFQIGFRPNSISFLAQSSSCPLATWGAAEQVRQERTEVDNVGYSVSACGSHRFFASRLFEKCTRLSGSWHGQHAPSGSVGCVLFDSGFRRSFSKPDQITVAALADKTQDNDEVALMTQNQGSFHDPANQVFFLNGDVYRAIFQPGVTHYVAAKKKGVYAKLIEAGFLLPHQETDPPPCAPEGTVYCLQHQKLPMVSYPWEWSFAMLKDAALLHLDAMEMLVPEGFWLRDGSAVNVQYDGKALRLIDTLSIGLRKKDSPWIAYRQFCSHFLAPLALAAYRDIRTFALWREYIDGYPLDLATRMLSFRNRYFSRLLIHLTLHARFQEKAQTRANDRKGAYKTPPFSDASLLGLIQSLRRSVSSIEWKQRPSLWREYRPIRKLWGGWFDTQEAIY